MIDRDSGQTVKIMDIEITSLVASIVVPPFMYTLGHRVARMENEGFSIYRNGRLYGSARQDSGIRAVKITRRRKLFYDR